MEKYYALIIDLKKSRTYSNEYRSNIQNFIKECIGLMNQIFKRSLQFDMIFSGGDEFQGMFSSAEAAFLYYRLLNLLIAPVEMRGGIGVGEWDIRINSNNSTEQDGSTYHNARRAIDNVNDRMGYDLLLYSGRKHDKYVNSEINISICLINEQSEAQNELSLLTELMYPIVFDEAYDVYKLESIKQLIDMKNTLPFYSKWRRKKSNRRKPNFIQDIHFVKKIDVWDPELHDYFISSGNVKGLSYQLDEIIGTSRQSIDRSIKAGNIFQIRNASIVALRLMAEAGIGF